jgi:hypothetical protein
MDGLDWPQTTEAGLASRVHAAVTDGAAEYAASLVDATGAPLYSLTRPADAAFLRELAAVHAVQTVVAETPRVGAPSVVSLVLSSLTTLGDTYGEDAPQYQVAWAQLASAVPQLAATFAQTAGPAAAAVTVVTLVHPEAADARVARSVAAAPAGEEGRMRVRRANGPAYLINCYNTLAQCQAATNCTGNGACALRANLDAATECYTCKCALNYAGEECQYYDISSIFWIMVFLVVFLIISVALTSMVVAYIDPGTGTLLFKTASSGRAKAE